MIRRVRGTLLHRGTDAVEVMTDGGVGYELRVSTRLLQTLPTTGAEVEIHAVLVVRDDRLDLFGFGSALERELFLRLRSVSKVGPSVALALIGALPAGRLVRAIRGKDHAVLRSVSGVGKKKAELIVLDLADRLDDLVEEEEVAEAGPATAAAVQALRSLGYGPREAEEAVARAAAGLDGRDVSTEELVKLSLRHV